MNKQQYKAMSLPYGLYCEVSNKKVTYNCVKQNNVDYSLEFHDRLIVSIPICRPLSDLTKPIVQANYNDGKPFIPIVELLRIEQNLGLKYAESNHKVLNIDVHESAEGNTYQVEYEEPYSNVDNGLIQFSYSERFRRFGKVMFKPYSQPLGVGYQLDMFQLLISWHFNLMDESEPFIDVNSLPENPYK